MIGGRDAKGVKLWRTFFNTFYFLFHSVGTTHDFRP